jgi:hypothetical protein
MLKRGDEAKGQPVRLGYDAFRQAILLQGQGRQREAEWLYRAWRRLGHCGRLVDWDGSKCQL